MGVFNNNIHNRIYFFGLVLLGVAIPLSEFVTSLASLILSVNWLLEGNFKNKLRKLYYTKSILFFISVLLIHILWLFNTSDFQYAFHDIKIKLPLLALPVIMGTSSQLSAKQTKVLIMFFVASVFAGTLVSTSILLGIYDYKIDNLRDISIFISHIRFSLMIDLAIFILYYYLIYCKSRITLKEKVVYVFILVWLIVFLYLLQSLTGIVIFLIVSLILIFKHIHNVGNKYLRMSFLSVIVLVICLLVYYVYASITRFYDVDEVSEHNIEMITKQGNTYEHNFKDKTLENGHYVYLYVCDKELMLSWNKISKYKYWKKDKTGQNVVRYTLLRYLTSKGLRKDAEGVASLTIKDIRNIENGVANYIFADKYSVDAIIYKLIWEMDVYLKTNNPNNNSLTQRIEYLKAAKEIIKDNFWFGTGTGDPKTEFKKQYVKMQSKLDEKNRRRAHNQYVTFLLTFGIFGFMLTMIALFAPYFLHKDKHHILFSVFMLIVLFSMLNEDTLETQPGISFFTYFYCLFLYSWNNQDFVTNQK